ncbi:MAG: hypothetical protein JWR11_6062 [Mycobacterium sp.]|jgi:hypothetical protein|nr:hypothetical protein [Mycobacterium sp.]
MTLGSQLVKGCADTTDRPAMKTTASMPSSQHHLLAPQVHAAAGAPSRPRPRRLRGASRAECPFAHASSDRGQGRAPGSRGRIRESQTGFRLSPTVTIAPADRVVTFKRHIHPGTYPDLGEGSYVMRAHTTTSSDDDTFCVAILLENPNKGVEVLALHDHRSSATPDP